MSLFANRFVDMSAHRKNIAEQEKRAAAAYTAKARGTSPDNNTPTTPVPPQAERSIVGRVFRALTR